MWSGKKGPAEGRKHPVGPLLGSLGRRGGGCEDGGAGGGGDEQLGVLVGLEGVVGKLAALLKETLAVSREGRMISNP